LAKEGLVAVEGDFVEEALVGVGEVSVVVDGDVVVKAWLPLEGAVVVVRAKLGALEAPPVEGGAEKDLVAGEPDLLDLVAVRGDLAAAAPPQGEWFLVSQGTPE
jgi:hypothetical protein